jgi:hypothetical protein
MRPRFFLTAGSALLASVLLSGQARFLRNHL